MEMKEQEKEMQPASSESDWLVPFQLENAFARGRLVRLTGSIDTMLAKHAYPEAVSACLARATVMAVALGSSMKFDGIFTVQTQTDGPIGRLVVDVTSDGAYRACATFDETRLDPEHEEGALLGSGQLVFTLDQKITDQRYQGVVRLEKESLVRAFQLYFRQSEQIPTALVVAAQKTQAGAWRAGCLMLQRMPREGGAEIDAVTPDTSVEDDWLRVMSLMQTCTDGELLDTDLAQETLLYRLFHQEGVRVFEKVPLRAECRCSRTKLAGVLGPMPAEEKATMLDETGHIEVTCHFCNESYRFTLDDLEPSST